MNALLQFLFDGISEGFGRPAKLFRLLAERPDIRIPIPPPSDNISSGSVVRWHELGKAPATDWPRHDHGRLLGWKTVGKYYYESFVVHRPEFAQLGRSALIESWSCDIQQVHGFSASKSDLAQFRSTDEMVECNSHEMIADVSHQGLARNLAHSEVRIVRPNNTADFFKYHQWDGRLFLMNDGGSHHFASAKYISKRLGEPVPLSAPLHTYSLNTAAIVSLRRDFDFFVISDAAPISVAFHEAMESFKATWLWTHMPHPFDNAKAILLPKNERRSQRVALALRNAGVVDLGVYLEELSYSGKAIDQPPPAAYVQGLAA